MYTVNWLNISTWFIDETLADTTTLGQSGPGSSYIEGVLYIPKSSRAEASSSDGLVSYPGHSLGRGSYSCTEMQSVYSTAPGDWDKDGLLRMLTWKCLWEQTLC